MSRNLPLLFCLALSAASSSAQSTGPQPPQQSASAVPTIQAKAQLVIVDVVVTDSHQNSIHHLKPTDFTVLEGNQPQQIKYFEEHAALSPEEAGRLSPIPKMPPGVFTNFSPAPANGPINILLLDTLNTPMTDQSFVRDQLRKYLKSAPPGAPIAIFGLTTRLLLLQGFTSDPELLKSAIDMKKPKASPLLDDAVSGGGGPQPLSETFESMGSSPGADMIANLQQFEAQQQSFQLQLRAKYTLDAMNQLARYLSAFPGRKNLIWFSGSFPISILPDGDIQDPFAVVASSEDE
ncbi:MAG: VWA domain-containing protein, partial [Edaphobacter sp.]